MKHADFVHLHNHSQFSLLDGACRINDMVERAVEFKMPALALTDHGNLFGAVEFYTKCLAKGIVPIIGCETYVAPQGRGFKQSVPGAPDGGFHLILLAKNITGYKNLVKLVSQAYLEGFYHRPRIDFELLRDHAEGLIATSACAQGEVEQALLNGRPAEAEQAARRYLDLFGPENYYLEIQDHNIEVEDRARPGVIALARKLGVNLVATNDCHYLMRTHAPAHEALLCIQTGKTLNDTERMRYSTEELYFKSVDEMKSLFAATPEAIENTLRIAEACRLELDLKTLYLPEFPIAEGFSSRDEYLKHLADRGLAKRYPHPTQGIHDRLSYELSVIQKMGYAGYFLIVADLVHYAKNRGIPVGPGRGSAAGSLVSYCLEITDIDPIQFGLLFERFLNPDRISMPDIDIDFSDRGRDEVIQYVIQKYGKDNVCQIITFGTMSARGVVRDMGRVLGMSYSEVDRIAKIIPAEIDMTLEKAIRLKPELTQMATDDPRVAKLLDYSRTLEGLTRHASTHAAGVVIAPAPLTEFVPLYRGARGEVTTQYDMKWIEKIGLLKMDFLGLRTLTVLDDAEHAVASNRGVTIDWAKIGLEDSAVYRLFATGETIGIFQFESSGMRDYLRKLRPTVFEDLIVMNALYRPGPLDANMIDEYIDRKHGRKQVIYDHPKIERVLKDTYGIIVYQDQVMQVASELAGFSMGKADTLRKAMGKKDSEIMARMKQEFIDGAVNHGVEREIAGKVFDFCETFARYGFNRAHSASYAMLAYRSAYLKARYPVEFMAASMSSEMADTDRIRVFMQECRRLSIPVSPPDINESQAVFTASGDRILFGLSAVKNVGMAAVESIVAVRNTDGPFTSLYDFTSRADSRAVNRRALEALITAGAFDKLPGHRHQLLEALNDALSSGARVAEDRRRGQESLFGGSASAAAIPPPTLPDVPKWSDKEIWSREKEALGFYVSGHPLSDYTEEMRLFTTCSADQAGDLPDESEVQMGGIITQMKSQLDKKGQMMAFFTLEDFAGSIECLCFSDPFKRFQSIFRIDSLVLLSGRVSTREGERPKLIIQTATLLSESRNGAVLDLHITLTPEQMEADLLASLEQLLTKYDRGNGILYFYYPVGNRTVKVKSNRVRLEASRELVDSLRELLGADAVFCSRA
ncbi:MAG: DNA polymerase III subunit alpha [candidate division Zixibacteria bacterium]|nr:DNA polymerase III subunit alpha [candidate division Zixibacteria bacterium]